MAAECTTPDDDYSPRTAARPAMKNTDAVAHLIEQAAALFSISPRKITGPDRHRESVWPRHAVCLVARQVYGLSYSQIARAIGGRDHSTILHAVDNAAGLVEHDAVFRERVQHLQAIAEQYKAGALAEPLRTTPQEPAAIGRLSARLRELARYDPARFASLKAAILQ